MLGTVTYRSLRLHAEFLGKRFQVEPKVSVSAIPVPISPNFINSSKTSTCSWTNIGAAASGITGCMVWKNEMSGTANQVCVHCCPKRPTRKTLFWARGCAVCIMLRFLLLLKTLLIVSIAQPFGGAGPLSNSVFVRVPTLSGDIVYQVPFNISLNLSLPLHAQMVFDNPLSLNPSSPYPTSFSSFAFGINFTTLLVTQGSMTNAWVSSRCLYFVFQNNAGPSHLSDRRFLGMVSRFQMRLFWDLPL